jgi:predicted AAA+ superfamily ATPase
VADLVPRLARGLLDELASALRIVIVNGPRQSGKTNSAKHLRWLRDRLGERFTAGVVLHLGQRASSFGDGIHALPVSTLWGHAQA